MPKIKITDRESLTKATMQAHIDAPASTGSWIAKIEKRAEVVSQPAWDEIVRLRKLLEIDQSMLERAAEAFINHKVNMKAKSYVHQLMRVILTAALRPKG